MAVFIKQVLFFLLLVGGLLFLGYTLNSYLIERYPYELRKDTRTLITGPSLTKSALDPNYIPFSENISTKGEHYPESLTKLKYILPKSPQLENIVLCLNPAMLIKRAEYRLKYNYGYQRKIVSRIYPITRITDFEGWGFDRKKLLTNYYLRRILPQGIYLSNYLAKDSSQIQYPYIGSYRYTKKSNLARYEKLVLQRMTEVPREYGDFSPYMMQFLDETLDFIESYGLKVYLVNPPVHQFILDMVPEDMSRQYEDVVARIKQKHKDVVILDYMRYPLADSMFVNQNHINHYGAKIISKKLAEAIGVGQL